jgi:hypothetical protein
VLTRLREALRVQLSLGDLFEYPTVASLAQHIASIRDAALAFQTPPETTLEAGEIEGEV